MHTLKAKLRLKGKAGFLRRQGWIPAVVYGPTVENTPLVIDRKDLQDLFSQITRSSDSVRLNYGSANSCRFLSSQHWKST